MDLDLSDTVKYAIAMSTITISHEDTIHPDMTDELVKENINKINWTEENILNNLIISII